MQSFWRLAALVAFALWGWTTTANGAEPASYRELVLADEPAAYWTFDGADSGNFALTPSHNAATGPGPRLPDFPLFSAENRAADISRRQGFLKTSDPGENSALDFAKGDAITMEGWVSPESLAEGAYVYIVGKGRTHRSGMGADNQNYALRLFGNVGGAAVSFLFRSAGADGQYHRWNSNQTFGVGDGWHHVAVTYEFGNAKSLRGYLDGEPIQGRWDMGGATDRTPVVDDDELWIGSSMGGKAGSTFSGLIDEVAIYRRALSAERIAARFHFTPPTPSVERSSVPGDAVRVEILEGLPDKDTWSFRSVKKTDDYTSASFGFIDVPRKYNAKALIADRSNPFLLRAMSQVVIPPGTWQLLIRSRGAARLYFDEQLVAETPFFNIPNSGHGQVTPLDESLGHAVRALRRGDSQKLTTIEGDGKPHLLRFETIVGGRQRRPELGEAGVFLGRANENSDGKPGDGFRLVSPTNLDVPLTDAGWLAFAQSQEEELAAFNAQRRREVGVAEAEYWKSRHELARKHVLKGAPTSGSANSIDRFVDEKLSSEKIQPTAPVDDLSFLRRLTLDTIGTIPTPDQVALYLADAPSVRRENAIEQLLANPGWADHWVGYWQDVLAENPNVVNPTLNNTGPFRWWIYESFLDNKPMDRFATELIMMEGSAYFGGPAGFSMATENDAPLAAKGHILGQAFLGLEMTCARCHDAPFHSVKQEDLFRLAAMLARAPQSPPATSTVPEGGARSGLIEVTLRPGEKVPPQWPFSSLVPDDIPPGVLRSKDDSRERLAALVTLPHNERFAQVLVNRLWKRYLGRGFVEPIHDWEHARPLHDDLLAWLGRELVTHDYDLKHVARLIFRSRAYQRQCLADAGPGASQEVILAASLFAGPTPRRMTAEQLVDSLFLACGKPLDSDPMNIDIDGSREYKQSLNLGQPRRAWMFTSLSNERDRPSLALPYAEPFVAVLEMFGWRASRQFPESNRNDEPIVLQPAMLANGALGRRIVTLSDDSAFTAMALVRQPLEQLLERAFVRTLSRSPNDDERATFKELLSDGYDDRVREALPEPRPKVRRNQVGWSNHLHPEATIVKQELEAAVRAGDPPTLRLDANWRERLEDTVWTLVNSPEFMFVP